MFVRMPMPLRIRWHKSPAISGAWPESGATRPRRAALRTPSEGRNVRAGNLHRIPHDLQIHGEILVNDHVSHPRHLSPRNVRMTLPN